MRTRILGRCLNSEVEEYLQRNDIIIVPVGTTEMHGGFPLECETVISEAYALKMAQACDGMILTGLPYFYSGATASGRGTLQVSVRQGIDYLGAIARDLLRMGFKRQIYISFHGPAHMTICPMIRDLYDETGVPALYIDLMMQMEKQKDLFDSFLRFHDVTVGAYKIMGRLEDIPLVTGYDGYVPQSCAPFSELFSLAYQSAAVGYCFGEKSDHMPTPDIPDLQTRDEMALKGENIITAMVDRMDMPGITEKLSALDEYGRKNEEKYPWMPSAWNKGRK